MSFADPFFRPWISYINRCHALLQSGLFVADALYYVGDGAPIGEWFYRSLGGIRLAAPGFKKIVLEEGDSGDTSTNTGQQTVKRLLPLGIDVLVGAASSGFSCMNSTALRRARSTARMKSPFSAALSEVSDPEAANA